MSTWPSCPVAPKIPTEACLCLSVKAVCGATPSAATSTTSGRRRRLAEIRATLPEGALVALERRAVIRRVLQPYPVVPWPVEASWRG